MGISSKCPLRSNEPGRTGIWANQPIHSFFVACLNPCLQAISVRVGSPKLNNRLLSLVTNELVGDQDFLKITGHLWGVYCNVIKKKAKRSMSTCNRLDWETLGYWLIMPMNLPEYCWRERELSYMSISLIPFNIKTSLHISLLPNYPKRLFVA